MLHQLQIWDKSPTQGLNINQSLQIEKGYQFFLSVAV